MVEKIKYKNEKTRHVNNKEESKKYFLREKNVRCYNEFHLNQEKDNKKNTLRVYQNFLQKFGGPTLLIYFF